MKKYMVTNETLRSDYTPCGEPEQWLFDTLEEAEAKYSGIDVEYIWEVEHRTATCGASDKIASKSLAVCEWDEEAEWAVSGIWDDIECEEYGCAEHEAKEEA